MDHLHTQPKPMKRLETLDLSLRLKEFHLLGERSRDRPPDQRQMRIAASSLVQARLNHGEVGHPSSTYHPGASATQNSATYPLRVEPLPDR
jgi:hypothetical protein